MKLINNLLINVQLHTFEVDGDNLNLYLQFMREFNEDLKDFVKEEKQKSCCGCFLNLITPQ